MREEGEHWPGVCLLSSPWTRNDTTIEAQSQSQSPSQAQAHQPGTAGVGGTASRLMCCPQSSLPWPLALVHGARCEHCKWADRTELQARCRTQVQGGCVCCGRAWGCFAVRSSGPGPTGWFGLSHHWPTDPCTGGGR
jgi:hypothetical protein